MKRDGHSHNAVPQQHVQQGSQAPVQLAGARSSAGCSFDVPKPTGQSSELLSSSPASCHILSGARGSITVAATSPARGPMDDERLLAFGTLLSPHDVMPNMDKTSGVNDRGSFAPLSVGEEGRFASPGIVLSQTYPDGQVSLADNSNNQSEVSDVYANSDYTDTVSSVDSQTFLLGDKGAAEDSEDQSSSGLATGRSRHDSAPFYKNAAFRKESEPEQPNNFLDNSGSKSQSILFSRAMSRKSGDCEDLVADVADVAVNSCVSGQCAEDAELHGSDRDQHALASETAALVENKAVAELVELLKERCPDECVDVQVQELQEPVYQQLTEPIDKDGWMNSTESLQQYKRHKQGHSHLVPADAERGSFRSLAASSLSSLSRACQVALVHIRTDMEFGSMLSLEDHGKCPEKFPSGKGFTPSELESLKEEGKQKAGPSVASGRHKRNMISMAIMITLVFISVNSARNLQSSINHEGGVGINSLASFFVFYTLGSLVSPVLVRGLGVRLLVLIGLLVQLAHIGANLYPAMWLMVPSSGAGGFTVAVMWNAMSTYIVLLARGEAEVTSQTYERVSDKFFGVFSFIFQFNLMVGSVIASLVLTFGNEAGTGATAASSALVNTSLSNSTHPTLLHVISQSLTADNDVTLPGVSGQFASSSSADCDNATASLTVLNVTKGSSNLNLCGAAFCYHFAVSQETSSVPDVTKFILFGTFMLLIVVAFFIAAFFMEPLCPHLLPPPSAPLHMVKHQLVSLARFSRNPKFILLAPMLLYLAMQFSFISSDVMMAYVTCPLGVHMVGYTMVCYGTMCIVASYISQALALRVSRSCFITIACTLNASMLIFMRIWQPHPDNYVPLFIITGLWGFADGIWNVQTNCLLASVFADHYEDAFTGYRMGQGLGGALVMSYSQFLCMTVKIYMMLAFVAVVFAGYVGAEILIRREKRRNQMELADNKQVV